MSRGGHIHHRIGQEERDVHVGGWETPPSPRIERRTINIALCGYEGDASYRWVRMDDDPAKSSCPACNKKLAKQRLKQRDGGPKLEAVQDKEARGGFRYNQGWKALVDGEAVAYLGYQEHWWRIYPLRIKSEEDDPDSSGLEIVNHYSPLAEDGDVARRGHYGLSNDVLRYKTRDDALLACAELHANGTLKTGPQLLKDRADHLADLEVRRAARRRATAEAKTRHDEMLDALNEIMAMQALSNYQRSGLQRAIETLQGRTGD